MTSSITYEQLKFISDELKKNYIPTDEIKNEFFRRFLPTIKDDIELYKVVFPESYIDNYPLMKEMMNLDWLFFSEYCDVPSAFKDKEFL